MILKLRIMDLEARKYNFIQELFKVEKPGTMDKLEKLLKKEQAEESIDIEDYNKSIDQSLADIEQGNVYTHEQVGERLKQWAKE